MYKKIFDKNKLINSDMHVVSSYIIKNKKWKQNYFKFIIKYLFNKYFNCNYLTY